jgi:hypothetical protein
MRFLFFLAMGLVVLVCLAGGVRGVEYCNGTDWGEADVQRYALAQIAADRVEAARLQAGVSFMMVLHTLHELHSKYEMEPLRRFSTDQFEMAMVDLVQSMGIMESDA